MPRLTWVWLLWYSSGPAKQNRPSSTMIAVPVIARLLVVNARKLSWAPALALAPEAITSPPSGARGLPAGDGCVGAVSGAAIADPWVERAVGDVGGQVADHGGHADDQRPAEHHREVVGERGLPEQQAHAGEVEYRLRDDRAGHDIRKRQPENGDHRQQRVAQHMTGQHQPLRHALGPRHPDVVLGQYL